MLLNKIVSIKLKLIEYTKTNPRKGYLLSLLLAIFLTTTFLAGMIIIPLAIVIPLTLLLNYILPGHWLFIAILDLFFFVIAAVLVSDFFIDFEQKIEDEIWRLL